MKTQDRIVVCAPVFNDWESAARLVADLDRCLGNAGVAADVLLVDDGSTVAFDGELIAPLASLGRVEVLRLRRNLGHQRAICLGLTFLSVERDYRAVVVMDADGEDAAADVPTLLEAFDAEGGSRVVFAQRRRRTESLFFKLGYSGYRLLHLLLVGRDIKVGNFSVISADHVASLTCAAELWNHYAASVFHARLPVKLVPIDRGRRLVGRSQMNLMSLVLHGLSAISVYADVVGVRLAFAAMGLGLAALAGLCVVVGIRFLTDLAIPGWATAAAGLLTVAFLQALGLAVAFVVFTLHERNNFTFLPRRDYLQFIRPDGRTRE